MPSKAIFVQRHGEETGCEAKLRAQQPEDALANRKQLYPHKQEQHSGRVVAIKTQHSGTFPLF